MNTTNWKMRLLRELPFIAAGALVAAGTLISSDESVTPVQTAQAVQAVGDQLTFLNPGSDPVQVSSLMAGGPTLMMAAGDVEVQQAKTAKPFAQTAIGTKSIADIDHTYVSKWVSRFTGARKNDLATTLGRMEPYTAMIERKLADRGMPQELVYLALIESGGDPKATSPVRAKGLWQFMAPTAKQYGLKVGGRVDERTNPERATDAALEYLSDLHDRFGSWYLAAAAYNTGQGRVAKVMRQVLGKSKGTDADFYKIAHRLPKETRDYVPKLVAVARIAKAPEKYGLD